MLVPVFFLFLITATPHIMASHVPWDKIYDGICLETKPKTAELDMAWVLKLHISLVYYWGLNT